MSSETNNHDHQASYFNGSWSCPEFPWDSQQSESDQSSISFGRYSSESLSWERWSVFAHNRCKEELEKFKNPGLVAQKRAYFEEYYKKIRAMKALQAQQDEVISSHACQDAHNSNAGEETVANSQVSKVERNGSPISSSDSNTIANLNLSPAGIVGQSKPATEGQQSSSSECNDKASMKDRIETSLSVVKVKNSLRKVSTLSNPSGTSSKTAMKSNLVSSTVNQKESHLKKCVPSLQTKGTVASIRSKTKLECTRTMKIAAKQSDNPEPTLNRKTVHRAANSLLPSKKSDPKPAGKINKKITEVSSTGPLLNSLLAREKLVSSYSSERARPPKPSATHQGFAGKSPKKLPAQSTKVMPSSPSIGAQKLKPRSTSQGLAQKSANRLHVCSNSDKPLSSSTSQGLAEKSATRLPICSQSSKQLASSSSIRAQKLKPRTTSQDLAEKSATKLPVLAQSVKSISNNKIVAGGLRKMAPAKGSAEISTLEKSSQSIRVIGQKSSAKEEKEKEGNVKKSALVGGDLKPASSAPLQRDRKPVSSMVSSSQRPPKAKSVNKRENS